MSHQNGNWMNADQRDAMRAAGEVSAAALMARADAVTTEEPEENNGRRAMDSELRVMGSILRTLEDLDQAAQRRVLNYLGSRFASTP